MSKNFLWVGENLVRAESLNKLTEWNKFFKKGRQTKNPRTSYVAQCQNIERYWKEIVVENEN